MLELIIVVAVIAILISLLLPAIQQSREAARRAQCRGNLMNIGFALQNYESAFGVLPPGSVSRTAPVLNRLKDAPFSWIAQLLPHFEAGGTYRQIDFRESPLATANDRARMSVLPLLLCPSSIAHNRLSIPLSRRTPVFDAGSPELETDVDEFQAMSTESTDMIEAITCSYAGCHHDVEVTIDVDQNGVLHLNSGIASREIPDGRSQTIAVGEVMTDLIRNTGWMVGLRSTLRNTGPTVTNGYTYPRQPGALSPELDYWWKFESEEDAIDETGGLSQFEARAMRLRFDRLVGGFGSSHSDGANFLFCDGAVRSVSRQTDQALYRRMGSRRDGGLVELD